MEIRLKHIVLFSISLLFAACAMESNKVNTSESDYKYVDIEESAATEADDYGSNISGDQALINEKLQDFYDLLALQNKHPEFTKEVIEQLRNYTSNSIEEFSSENAFVIKNISQLGQAEVLNDSVKKLKLVYDKISENVKVTDTIYALITSKTIVIDGESFKSNKIQFSKN
ncbi:hypothetical protein [Winogradskyella tangerina]|uniref:hypothetical protein n=1 Tax=Winogradskyella tangerina TaxID=2023240 RepID=UPI0013004C64|nr:hypothetical protein [Winogradskyella tangerina]